MKQSEIKGLSTAELQEKLGETKKRYADLKMAHAILRWKIQFSFDRARRTISPNCNRVNKKRKQ